MKISEIKPGTRILVPCIECGRKRSLLFTCAAQYALQKSRKCEECRQEHTANNNSLHMTKNYRKPPAYQEYS